MKKTVLFGLACFVVGIVAGAALKDPVSRKYTIIKRNLKNGKTTDQ